MRTFLVYELSKCDEFLKIDYFDDCYTRIYV